MSIYELEKYEDLKKIEDSNFITTLQEIKSSISNTSSPIPNRILCINLLRSMCKFQLSYFYNFFWGIRNDFINNCLNYNENPRLQQISIFFLNEILNNIYNEISHENMNEFIFWAYHNIFNFLTNNNNILKSDAQKIIKDISQNIPSEAIIISLIKSLRINDENILNYLFNCIEIYFNEFVSYGINFDFILDNLEVDKSNEKDYYIKIQKAFKILNNILQNQGSNMAQIYESINNKNKDILSDLIK